MLAYLRHFMWKQWRYLYFLWRRWQWIRRENRIRWLPEEIQRTIAEIQSYSLSDVVKNACTAKDGFSQAKEMLQFLTFAQLFEATIAADVTETILNQTGSLEQFPSYRLRHSIRIDLFPVGISSMGIAVEDVLTLPNRVRQVGEKFLWYDWLSFVQRMTESGPPMRTKVWERQLEELHKLLTDLRDFISFSGNPTEVWQELSELLDQMSVGAYSHDRGPLATIAYFLPREKPYKYYQKVLLGNERVEHQLKEFALATDERVLRSSGSGKPDWTAHRMYWGFCRGRKSEGEFPFITTTIEELLTLPGMDIPYVARN